MGMHIEDRQESVWFALFIVVLDGRAHMGLGEDEIG